MFSKITPVILTMNEDANIARSLDLLRWAEQIVVLDSGSEDRTSEIARSFPNVRFEIHPFDELASQWNRALAFVQSEWVLALDADYMLTSELREELVNLTPDLLSWGYEVRFRYAVNGILLRASLYPPKVVLYRRHDAVYAQDGHKEQLVRAGKIGTLAGHIVHDDRKSLSRWIVNQSRYAEQEAQAITSGDRRGFGRRLRSLVVVAPVLVPIYLLAVKGLLLDGRAGLRYVLERTAAECLISLHVLDRRLRESVRKDQ